MKLLSLIRVLDQYGYTVQHSKPLPLSARIRLTHLNFSIGGHRFAATCFTSAGDWYGLLASTDAKVFVDHLAKQGAAGSSDRDIWWAKWRGRTGFTSSAQLALAEKGVALQNVQAVDPPALALASSLRKKAKDRQAPLGNALDVPFVTYEGDTVTVRGFEGETLMDVAKRQELVSQVARSPERYMLTQMTSGGSHLWRRVRVCDMPCSPETRIRFRDAPTASNHG